MGEPFAVPLAARLALFPSSTTLKREPTGSHLNIASCDLNSLAAQYGTPLYLYDRVTMDESVDAYRQSLVRFYPGKAGIIYAGKAFLCTAIAQWAVQQDLWLDCTGAGELRVAANANAPARNVLVHGVNKTTVDLKAALEQAGTLVVDNLDELERLSQLIQPGEQSPELWLRLRPGIAVDTHQYTQTGQFDSKFGMSFSEAKQMVRICIQRGLRVTGVHFHQGSHFHNPEPLQPAIEVALDLISGLHEETGWLPDTLCPGGGWGVAYHEDELPQPDIEQYVSLISKAVVSGCKSRRIPLPLLMLEPGRSLVARAGVALYRVGGVKHTPGRRWLLLDGGLADNPRPALYKARYSALPVDDPDRPAAGPAWLAGPFCESGDILIESLPLPDIKAGELVAVPVSGAYQLSMGSHYNGARLPAVLWLEAGEARLIQRRETLDDLVRRDCLL